MIPDAPTTDQVPRHDANEQDPSSLISTINESSRQHSTHINDLPFDVLVILWNLAWDRNGSDRLHFPVVISHVCRMWRQYALDHSSFWSTVDFKTKKIHLEKTQVWLERSKNSPVNISIGPQPFRRSSIPNAKQILHIILPHLWHCRKLNVKEVPEKVERVIFDRLRDASAPLLETLNLSTADYATYLPRPFRNGSAPSLSELSIGGRIRHYFLERFPNIRRLHIRDTTFETERNIEKKVDYVRHILSKLPRLEALLISNGFYHIVEDIEDSQILGIIPPPSLTHESMEYFSPRVCYANRNAILASLHLPNVRYFPDPRKPLNEFAFGLCIIGHMERTQPFPRLVSLCLGGNYIYTPESLPQPNPSARNTENLAHLEDALASVPLLESLTFESVDFGSDGKISCLSRVCPKLEWLAFQSCAGCTLGDIMSVVEGRIARKTFEPIRHLTIREWAWDRSMIDDEKTWALLEKALKAKAITPEHSANDYLSRFDVIW